MAIKGFNASENQQNLSGISDLSNNSGQGPASPVLDIVKRKFNWGAFLLTWIWGIPNKTWITFIMFPLAFISLIPIVGGLIYFGVNLYLGIKGNEWAWQNKKWKSIEHFHSVQRRWAIAGSILLVLGIVIGLALPSVILPFSKTTSGYRNETTYKKCVATILQSAMLNEVSEVKCKGSSEGLASCFAQSAIVSSASGNVIETADRVIWNFSSDGICAKQGNCFVTVTDDYGLNKKIPLYLENGYLKIPTEEINID